MAHHEELEGIGTSEAELVVDLPCETGEGPLWHEATRTLYWVDIPTGTVYRYSPANHTNEIVYQHSGSIGGFTFQEDDSLILFSDNGSILRMKDSELETIVPQIEEVVGSRFNDVIADPEGRVFCGTMPLEDAPARLYRLDPDKSLHLVHDDLTLSNGMGFSPDLSVFYHTDSNSGRIYRMRYDRVTGVLSDREILVEIPKDEGVPDGMAVDVDGTIWSARYGGRGIFHYSAEGKLLEKIELPVQNVTSIGFAGDAYRDAYVTTAGGRVRSEEIGVLAGSLFRVTLNTRGRPPFRSKVGL